MTQLNNASTAAGIDLQNAVNLLTDYPNISANQADQLSDFIRHGPAVDVAFLKSTDSVKPQLEHFTANRPEFDTRKRDILIIAMMLSMLLVVMYLLASIGGN